MGDVTTLPWPVPRNTCRHVCRTVSHNYTETVIRCDEAISAGPPPGECLSIDAIQTGKARKRQTEQRTGQLGRHRHIPTSSAQMFFVSSSPCNFPTNSHTLPLPSSTGELGFFFVALHQGVVRLRIHPSDLSPSRSSLLLTFHLGDFRRHRDTKEVMRICTHQTRCSKLRVSSKAHRCRLAVKVCGWSKM